MIYTDDSDTSSLKGGNISSSHAPNIDSRRLKPINQTLVAVMVSTNPGQDKKLEGKVMSTVRSFRRTDHLRELAILLALYGSATPTTANANPFLAKAGETPTTVQVATCAVSGGFIHLYTAMDNGLFDKYGIKIDHRFISGSAMNLAALSADEVSFLYCAADGTIPGLASGVDGKLVASPLIGLPYVLLAHKEIKRLEDLKGKSIGVSKAGDLDDRLIKTLLKKFNLSTADVTIRPIGGSQPERTTR